MNDLRADALGSFASLLRAGLPFDSALERWPALVHLALRLEIEQSSRRVRSGVPLATALDPIILAWGEPGRLFANAVKQHLVAGGDVAATLDDLAASVEESQAREKAARAAAAGAKLSGRLIFGIPVVLVALTGTTRGGFDRTGIATIVLGLVLGCLGSWWITRLTPTPPLTDNLVIAAEQLIRGLGGGASLTEALDALACEGPERLRSVFTDARTLLSLGVEPRRAFRDLGSLGAALADSIDFGVPLSGALRSFTAARTTEARVAFESKLRRAPVLMAMPLSLCLLPSFLLIGLAPLLRSM